MIWRAEGFHCINCGAFVYPRYKTLIKKSTNGTMTVGGRDTHHCHGRIEDCDQYLVPAVAIIESIVPGVDTKNLLAGEELEKVKSAKKLETKEVPWA